MLKRSMRWWLALCLLPAGALSAQAPGSGTGTIAGFVHSGEGAPLPDASVTLRRSADSVRVAGTSTSASGAFRIEGMAAGSYRLEVSHLGYRTDVRSVVVAPGERSDVGVIRLEPGAIALAGVEVRAERSSVAILPDRSVYFTRDMPAATGGTATDVLRSVPELEVSPEGTVTARGAAPVIHINGRPAPMQGEALDQYLQQLPAERIERVEVISNPSARYEAEGQGGIINIVMKRGSGLGLSGSVAMSAGTRNQRSGSGNVHYQAGRLTLFSAASASFFGNDSETSDLRQNLAVQPPTWIQHDARNRNSGGIATADLSAEWKAGSSGAVWTDLGVGRNTSAMEAHSSYTHRDHAQILTQRYDRLNDREFRGLFGSGGLGYHHAPEEGGTTWSLEVRRSVNVDDHASESVRQTLEQGAPALNPAAELTHAVEGQEQNSFSVESSLSRGWGEAGQLEAGYRGSLRSTASDYDMRVPGQGAPAAADVLVGDFRNRERAHAAFVNGSGQFGRVFVQAGVRAEHVAIRRALPLSGERFEAAYHNFFPSAVVSTGLGAGGEVSLSYSRRADRPWGAILNPAIPVLDPLNRRVGNPYLTPRYTHSISLSLTRTGSLGLLQLSPYYRRTTNSWAQVRNVDAAGASTVTWQNLATISSYGGSLSASLMPVGPVRGFLNLSAYREVRAASDLHTDFSGSSTQLSVISNASVRATSAFTLNGSLTYLPARDVPQGRISAMVFTNLGARMSLPGGRGAITVNVVDPFELQRFTFTTRDRSHVQTGSSSFSARRATLGVSYTFGRPPQDGRGRGSPEEGQENPVQTIR
jgi:ferric enterobactin receptor